MGNHLSQIQTLVGIPQPAQIDPDNHESLISNTGHLPAGYDDLTAQLADLEIHLPNQTRFAVKQNTDTLRKVNDALITLGLFAHQPDLAPTTPEAVRGRIAAIALLIRLGVLEKLLPVAPMVTRDLMVLPVPEGTPDWLMHLLREVEVALHQAAEEVSANSAHKKSNRGGMMLAPIPLKEMEALIKESPLQVATLSGDMATLNLLISSGKTDINASDSCGRTALHAAVIEDNVSMVRALIRGGARLDACDRKNRTPLDYAIQSDCQKAASALLRAKPSLEVATYKGFSPLAQAANLGRLEIIDRLLTAGADPNFAGAAGAPVHHAIMSQNAKVLEMLLKRGCNPNLLSNSRIYVDEAEAGGIRDEPLAPIETAAIAGHPKLFNLLRRHGVDLGAPLPSGMPLLSRAAAGGNVDILNVLLAEGVPVNETDNGGRTPLHWAAGKAQLATFKRLLAKGADPLAHDKRGQSVLHAAVDAHSDNTNTDKLELVKLMLAQPGVRVNERNDQNETPLHVAAAGRDSAVVKLLLDAKANVFAKDHQGVTPLHCAAIGGSAKITHALLDAKADTEAVDNIGNTPLHLAGHRGQIDSVRALLIHGARIDARNKNQVLPLHAAAQSGNLAVVEILLQKGRHLGINGYSPGPNALTPIDLARAHRHLSVVDYLSESGASQPAGSRR